MRPKSAILFTILAFIWINAFAGNPHAVKPVRTDIYPCGQFINHSDWNFVENKGQLSDNQVQYYGNQGGVYLYCKPGKISFVFTKVENDEKISEATGTSEVESALSPAGGGRGWKNHGLPQSSKITTCRTDLILLNSNPSATILSSDQQEYYENFYTTGNADSGIANVHTFKTISYKNIYRNIDLVLHAKPNGMKYEFVVNPGGKVSDIRMQWGGLEKIKRLKNSKIEYSLAFGRMEESQPVSFQDKNIIESSFAIDDETVGFKVNRYNKTKVLVIDPTLIWGTYFGGSGGDYGEGIAVDDSGYVYISGATNSGTGIATSGAYQTSWSGNKPGVYNAFLSKFNTNGAIKWSTYYGGSYGEAEASSVATFEDNNIYITGQTGSSSGIATSGAYQSYLNGPYNAFISKFDKNGKIQWATYLGKGDGYGWGVATDKSGNVYFAGYMTGDSGLATKGAYQTSFIGTTGNAAGFFAKFNSNGRIQWATYYGTSGTTVGNAVATDKFGDIYFTGYSTTIEGIATNGAYQTSNNGSRNAFLAKFNNIGTLQWSTYFGGDKGDDGIGITTDTIGNVFITGTTTSDTGIATKAAYQTSYSGLLDGYVAKFNTFGAIQWATYFGGSEDDESSGITSFGTNIYIIGESSSPGLATNGAYKTSNNGSDAFIIEYNSAGNPFQSTYFGGNNQDFGYGIAIDKIKNIYIIGNTWSTSGIATNGAYSTSFSGSDTFHAGDAFIAKFEQIGDDAGISSILNLSSKSCPDTQSVKVLLHNFGNYVLDSVIIKCALNGYVQPAYHWKGLLLPDSSIVVDIGPYYFISGNDTIKCWTTKPNGTIDSIPENDTSISIINMLPLPTPNPSPSSYNICIGTHIKIGANAKPNYVYAWSSIPVGFSSNLANPVVDPLNNTVYSLSVTDTSTGCTNKNSTNVFVGIAHAPVVDVGKNQAVCAGFSAQIGSDSLAGDSYSWVSNPVGFTSSKAKLVVTPVITTSYLLTVTSSIGCTNFDSVTITVNPLPSPKAGNPQNICEGTAIQLGTSPITGHIYSWTSNPVGFSTTLSNPVDTPKTTTKYILKETNSATGCADSDSVIMYVVPLPIVSFQSKVINGYTYQFEAQNPNYRSWAYHWDFGDVGSQSDTASGYSVSHTYTQNRKYTVTLTVSVPGFCTVMYSDTIVIDLNFSLNIYPNAFSLQTDINYTLASPAHIRISVIDEIGRQIGVLKDAQLEPGEYNTEFNSAFWKTRPGMYFVLFEIDGTLYVRKIIQVESIYY